MMTNRKFKNDMPIPQKISPTSDGVAMSQFYSTPKVILVGPSLRVNEVAAELKSTGLNIAKTSFVKGMKEAVDSSVAAVIYVLPLKRSHVLSVHKNVKKQKDLKHLPFFVVAPEWTSARSEREMYKMGIRMIFEWPGEKQAFSDLFMQALSKDLKSVRADDTDEALKLAIDNRLITSVGNFRPPLQLTVYHGIAILRGQVSSIQLKEEVVSTIKDIPGVRGVVDQSLSIKKSKLAAKDLKKQANGLLWDAFGIESRTLEVEADSNTGHLFLRGTLAGPRKLSEILERLEKMHGVSKIIDETQVSAKIQRKDRMLAKRAERLIKKVSFSPQSKIRVKVIGGDLLLKGQVSTRIERSHLAQVLESLDGVKTVDNKMNVANAA